MRLILRRLCVCGHIIHITQLLNLLPAFDIRGLGFGMQSRTIFLDASTVLLVDRNTSSTMSQRSRAGSRNAASRETISDSVELCETEVCFLHIQLTRTDVLLPMRFISSHQGRQQSLSLGTIPVCNAVPCSHMTTLSEIVCVMNVRNQPCQRRSQAML